MITQIQLAAVAASAGAAAALFALQILGRRERRQIIKRREQSLVPGWRPGQKQSPPFDLSEMLRLDPDELPSKYNFFISAYIPRPIALVSSVSKSGHVNLAPFSYSSIVNHDPGIIVFSCVDKSSGGGDTLKNVEATKEFVVHIVSEWFLEAANHTCGNFAPEINEFFQSGLTPVSSFKVQPPRVAEAALAMECEVIQTIPMKNSKDLVSSTLVLGKVIQIHVNKNVYNQEKAIIVPEALRPVARLGGNTYSLIGDIFDIARPRV
mmetsp:Transcript_11655/g.15846  ORF Transcript_11655/g.15846 Transcript_11655/m.15846 type:complete len:265 (+) Transcript_11655:12-806(+)